MKVKLQFSMSLFFVLTSFLGHTQTESQRQKIINSNNKTNFNSSSRYSNQRLEKYNVAVSMALKKGWPVKYTDSNGNFLEIKELLDNNTPLYYTTFNEKSAFTSRANKLMPGGSLGLNLTGKELYVGVWDQDNANVNHQDFGGRALIFDNNTSPVSNHNSHVTGTIISSGTSLGTLTGRGIAFEAYAYISNWTNDLNEMESLAQNQGLLLSNHSYGLAASGNNFPEYIFGAYRNDSREIDRIMFDAPYYQAVIAAGNDRNKNPAINGAKEGYDLLSDFSTAKNAIVVAAVQELSNAYSSPSNVVMSNFSSWGPTDDNRIKPDISTKGVNVLSTSSNASNTAYNVLSGTSMAAPGITGTLLLLQQHFLNTTGNFMRSATLRGLMAHTADESGDADGPDPRFGWGLMNAEKAAVLISDAYVSNKKAFIQEFTGSTSLSNTTTFSKVVRANGAEPLIATISWTDQAGITNNSTVDLSTPVLVNDLDVRITKGNTTFFPWKLNSEKNLPAVQADNIVDNIEKVEIKQPDSDIYTITVSHKGTLIGGKQDFSLIVSGINEATLSNIESDFKKVNVWPNPADNFIKIYIELNSDEDAFIEVYDTTGRKNISQKAKIFNGVLDSQINIENLNAGLHFVRIKQGEKQTTWKVIKK